MTADNGDRPLRIGLVCPYSLTIPGGVQMQVLSLARELRRRGHPAIVLGPCDGPPPASFVIPLGNSLPTAANGSIAPLAPDLPASLRTVRAIREEGFDVINVHEPFTPGPSVTSVIAHPVPIVATFHAAGKSASYRVFGPALRRIGRRIDHRIAVSKDARALAQRFLGGEYEVWFNGVDLEAIRTAVPWPDPEVDAGTGAGDGERWPVVFFCGRHEKRKGLDVLIEAFADITRRNIPMRLWVAGVGPDTEALRQRVAVDPDLRERVDWLGRVSDEEKFARLRSADVFCAPSLGGESFGVVLIEAMAANSVVVASSLDGYRNVATHEHDALLVEPGDAAALADSLVLATHNHTLAARLRHHGADRAEDFAMTRLADLYLERYATVLSTTRS